MPFIPMLRVRNCVATVGNAFFGALPDGSALFLGEVLMKKILLYFLSVICAIFSIVGLVACDNKNKTLSAEEIYTLVSPSTVEITAYSSTFTSTGTGFFYSNDGKVITNYHVIEDCTSAIITVSNGATYNVNQEIGRAHV